MIGVDSNIIVYSLNNDLPEHKYCVELLENVATGKEIIAIPCIVFMESYHALVYTYKFDYREVKNRLIAIIDSDNVIIFDISTLTILYAFEIAGQYNIGGRDALITACLLENNIKKLYSHDRDFDVIKEIIRIDPVKK